MTTNDDSDDDEELIRPANPVQWQLTNSLAVEKATRGRIESVRDQIKFPRGGGRVEDLWGGGLSGGYDGSCVEVQEGPCSMCGRRTRDAHVVAMVPPKRVLASIQGRRRKLERPAGARTPRIENYQRQTVCARPTAGWKNNRYRKVNGV